MGMIRSILVLSALFFSQHVIANTGWRTWNDPSIDSARCKEVFTQKSIPATDIEITTCHPYRLLWIVGDKSNHATREAEIEHLTQETDAAQQRLNIQEYARAEKEAAQERAAQELAKQTRLKEIAIQERNERIAAWVLLGIVITLAALIFIKRRTIKQAVAYAYSARSLRIATVASVLWLVLVGTYLWLFGAPMPSDVAPETFGLVSLAIGPVIALLAHWGWRFVSCGSETAK